MRLETSNHQMKKVAVIGAGLAGLVTMRELREDSHSVTCFELEDDVGGTFYCRDDKVGAYNDIHLTISNYFMSFSSHIPKDRKRRYWTGSEYLEYLHDFADKYSLKKFVRFKTEVLRISPLDSETWEVEFRNSAGEIKSEYFDAVAICSGKFRNPNIPNINGLDQFKGSIHHSYMYKTPEAFKGKDVVCLGVGESGSDIAHQISKVANTAHLLIKRPKSIVSRIIFGDTNDSRTTRAAHYSFIVSQSNLEASLKTRIVQRGIRHNENKRERPLSSIWMWKYLVKQGLHGEFTNKNDAFFQDIDFGRLQLHLTDVDYAVEDGLILKDGTKIPCTDIMLSTGYKTQFDLIDHPAAKEAAENIRNCFCHMIHPDLRDTMAWIGFTRPDVGGVPTCAELQARYFSSLLAKRNALLPDAQLREEIARLKQEEEDFYFYMEPNKSENVKYYVFTRYLARLLGVEPKWYRLILNPRLFYNFYFGSMVAAQFRLFGHGKNYKEAKEFVYRAGITKAPLSHLLFFIPLCAGLSALAPAFRFVARLFNLENLDVNQDSSFRTVQEILKNQWPGCKRFSGVDDNTNLVDLFDKKYELEGFKFFLQQRYGVHASVIGSGEVSVSSVNSHLAKGHYSEASATS
ncbi:flavin-containing monooxygenase [Teredinibacter turnerae]|uniref:flavin-containing monooxygenase n=1 Tax=Teredinibacter turnerae TaxID=2426 RepID=UPI001E3A57D4|nr:NAD(P)-binding domain-containing protein [Teredinibacter turnerae]